MGVLLAALNPCPDCNGTGAIKDSEGWGWCERCNGRAIILALKKAPA